MLSQLKLPPIPRIADLSNRALWLSFAARFTDEVLSGLPDVLMPTIRTQLGLSYVQISLLHLALNYVAAVIEPIADLLIDIWQRRWLLAWGAAGVGIAVALMGLAPTFLILLAGFAIYGLASGPLAHTADVVLVESHPQAPDRIFARATMLDTLGALLAPLLVTATVWAGASWRWLMITVGASSLLYAGLLLKTRFPSPANGHGTRTQTLGASARQNLQLVLRNRQTWSWLAFIFVYTLLEAPLVFQTVWLNEVAGMSQSLIGLYRALELIVHLVSLFYLDRWLARSHYRKVLQMANLGLLFVYPLWLLWPGVWARFLWAIPLNFLFAVYWPISRSQSLTSVPGHGGTMTAIQSLLGLVPVSLLFGLLAQAVTLTTASLWVSVGALLLMLLIVARLPGPARRS